MDMSRISATFSVSLPPAMAEELERVRKAEHRTRSELVREALRQYMGRETELRRIEKRIADLAEDEPTADEIAALEGGRRAFRDGKFVTLDQLRHEMARRPQQPRRKKSQTRSGR
jgi:Arc/MetJ-type ribon-helix-helix transcriptional regulator